MKMAVDSFRRSNAYEETSREFKFHSKSSHNPEQREIYILVIGETGRAHNWGIYGYERNTTPLLQQTSGLIHFTDMVTQSNATHKSVPMLLSLACAENFEQIYHQKSIVSAFREAGFRTAFFSNHLPNHSFIDYFADEADRRINLKQEHTNSKKRILFRLNDFLNFEGFGVADINIGNIDKHFLSLPLGQRESHKSTIREFLHYLYSNNLLPVNLSGQVLKEPRRRRPERLPTIYSTEEIKQLLESVDQSTPKGKRDYLVLLLCAQYGLRASDIVRLKLDNFNWEKNIIRIRQYKTDVDIELPLLASVGNAVINYLKHGHPSPKTGILVVSHMRTTIGRPLGHATIHSIVTAAFRNSNIAGWQEKRHGPHSLRHSLASNLIKQEVSLLTISAALGHKSAESTRVYIKIDIDGLRKCGLAIPTMSNSWISGSEWEAVQK